MYCKFCGKALSANSTKCEYCGAKIDLNDGGQSFYDDNELKVWQNSIPTTKMIDAVPNMQPQAAYMPYSTSSPSRRSHAHSRRKKTLADRINFSNPNVLIISCVASVMIFVLLFLLIMSPVVKKKDDNENVTDYVPEVVGPVKIEQTPISGLTIIVDTNQIEYTGNAYIINDSTYVSARQILKAEGFDDGVRVKQKDVEFRFRYKNKSTKMEIEVEPTNVVYLSRNGGKTEPTYMKLNAVKEENEVFVPVRSFYMDILGYSDVSVGETESIIIVKK